MKLDITKDLLSLFTAVFIVDFIFSVLIRYKFGKALNDWYDQFGISAVFADVFSICIGLVLAYIFFINLPCYRGKKEFNGIDLLVFTIITIGIQVCHDLFFYYFVVKKIEKGHNKMIDVFLEYGETTGLGAIAVDASMMILSIFAFLLISNYANDEAKLLCFLLIFYAFQYIIYTPRRKLETILKN